MPIERTRSTSPGRGPKAIRLGTWTIALSPALSPALSTGPLVAAGVDVTRTAMVNGRTNGRNRFICEVRQAGDPERLTNRHTIFVEPWQILRSSKALTFNRFWTIAILSGTTA